MFQDIQSVTVTDINKAKDYIYNDLYTHAYDAVIEGFKEKRNGLYNIYKKNTEDENKILISKYQNIKLDSWYESLHSLHNRHIHFNQDKTSFVCILLL
ncbi:MAG: hypothetical protein IPO92_18955 [Saprospiraceae bacterium]|nr:hypothetical protein [Saprospiraceae bacterium]